MNFILPKVLQIIESKRYNSDFIMKIGAPLASGSVSGTQKQAMQKSQVESFKICKEAL